MYKIKYWLPALFVLLCGSQLALAENITTIEVRVKDLLHMDGFFDIYWDHQKGQLLLRIDKPGEEFIYQSSLARGVGSNDLGLDRGQLGDTRLVKFYRSGPKLLLIEQNLAY